LLTGLEHVFQGECNVDAGGFVDDEERRFPGEGFVGGLYAQPESAFCHERQIDSAKNGDHSQNDEQVSQIMSGADIEKM
jgi:hypothetical protein